MKLLSTHIAESLLTGKVTKPSTHTQPSSRKELQQIINDYTAALEPHLGQEVDLNWIDISHVDDLSGLFMDTEYVPVIDKWKIDHVVDFYHMFANNKCIKKSPIPVLQEKLLDKECYERMFQNCTSLEEPPVLPAKKLTKRCYTDMFRGCASLKVAPELPAKELAIGCYWNMFNGCSSLKVAPELPAKKLAYDCYMSMFCFCKNLKCAPELPAMDLAEKCYLGMFCDCTSLVNPPDLPAVKLEPNCYYGMFMGCTKLQTQAKTPNTVEISIHYGEDMYYSCPCENK